MTERRMISVIVPVLDESENVDRLHAEVCRVFAALEDRYDWELLFTDNHSSDDTFARVAAIAERDPRVRALRFSRNFGYQASILTGYLNARGDCVVQLDCDLQDPPELVLDFVKHWERGSKVVYGVRTTRREGPLITSARKVFYRLVRCLSEHDIPLDAGDFRLVDRCIVEQLAKIEDATPYLRGTITALGFEQTGVPYDRRERERGESKFSLRQLFGLAVDGILNQSILPLRFASYFGVFVFVLSLFTMIGYGVARLTIGESWPPGFTTIVCLLLAMSGMQAIFLGIIGEYVGRLYRQSKRFPTTIVERRTDEPPAEAHGSRAA